jgi:hypothetical protein
VLLALHQVANKFFPTSAPFIHFRVPALARTSGRGSGGSMLLSDITLMVHNLVAQSKAAIKLSVIN